MKPSVADSAAEPDAMEWLNDFADLAYLLGHEFNNFLNNLLLHISILELHAAEDKTHAELETIRRLGRELAAKVHQFQQLSRKHRPPPSAVDLNQVVRDVIAAAKPADACRLHLQLVADLPSVLGSVSDLRHLVELLVQAAAEALPATGGEITLRTELASTSARLVVDD